MKVLFVCLGNICRSPMAEAIFKDMAIKQGLNVSVDSAGTSGWHIGHKPHEGTLRILNELRIPTQGMKGSKLHENDFYECDYLIGMDRDNVKEMLKLAPKGTESKVHLFLDVIENKKGMSVPDPWYTDNFEETRDLILEASQVWVDKIKKSLV